MSVYPLFGVLYVDLISLCGFSRCRRSARLQQGCWQFPVMCAMSAVDCLAIYVCFITMFPYVLCLVVALCMWRILPYSLFIICCHVCFRQTCVDIVLGLLFHVLVYSQSGAVATLSAPARGAGAACRGVPVVGLSAIRVSLKRRKEPQWPIQPRTWKRSSCSGR